MNRQKLTSALCVVISLAFVASFGYFINFKAIQPLVQEVYERIIDYPEDLYQEYIKEAEEMISRQEYTCKYPTEVIFQTKDNSTILILKVGEYDDGNVFSNYVIATVKNFGTKEQETTFERKTKSAEEAHQNAEKYLTKMRGITLFINVLIILFTVYLITFSIKRKYIAVFAPILFIAGLTIFVRVMFKIA